MPVQLDTSFCKFVLIKHGNEGVAFSQCLKENLRAAHAEDHEDTYSVVLVLRLLNPCVTTALSYQ